MGKTWGQDPKEVGHMTSTVRKRRKMDVRAQLAFSFVHFYSIWNQSPQYGATTLRVGLLSSVKPLWKHPSGHAHEGAS